MGAIVIKLPNGLLGRFSDVVDDFTHINLTEDGMQKVLYEEYHLHPLEAQMKIKCGLDDIKPFSTIKGSGLDRWDDAIETIKMCHGQERLDELEEEIKNGKVDIYGFNGENVFLSNMFFENVIFRDKFTGKDRVFASSEHAYQAYKACNIDDYNSIVNESSPYKAKRITNKVDLDEEFHIHKLQLMRDIVFAKFSKNEYLKQKLLATGDCYIEETNHWNDVFWGVCNGVGENHLGLILMDVREELRA